MSCILAFSGPVILGMDILFMLKLLVALYSAVLFIQSGFDKVADWSGNSAFIGGMFQKTVLRPFIPLMMPIITILEVGAGLLSLAGAVVMLLGGKELLAVLGLLLGAKSILLLFLGLRVAKDYGGAAAITSYFIFFVAALALFMI